MASRPLTRTNWTTVALNNFVSDYFDSSRATMALGDNGRAHIAYYHSPDDTLQYAVESQSFTTSTVDHSRTFGPAAIELGDSGNAHVAYLSGGVRYGLNLSGTVTWTRALVDPTADDSWNSTIDIAVDAADTPHIAYVNSGEPVYHATISDTAWITYQVEARANIWDSGLSIGAETTGTAHLTYLNVEGSDLVLRHAAFSAAGWTTETLVTVGPNQGDHRQTPQLVAQGGKVYILYADCTAYRSGGEDYPIELMLNTWNGSSWSSTSLYQFSGRCTAWNLTYQLLEDDTGRLAMIANINSDSVRPSPLRVVQWISGGAMQGRRIVEASSTPVYRPQAISMVAMGSTSMPPHATRGNGFEYLVVDYDTHEKKARYTDENGNRTDYIPVGATTGESTDIIGIDRSGSNGTVLERVYNPSGLYAEYITETPKQCCLRTSVSPAEAAAAGASATPSYASGPCGSQVYVSATEPDENWVFLNWSGAASGSNLVTNGTMNGRIPNCSIATANFEPESESSGVKTANPASPDGVYPQDPIAYRLDLSWKNPVEDAIIQVTDPYPWPRVEYSGGLQWGPYINCQHNATNHRVACSGNFPASAEGVSTYVSFDTAATCDIYTTENSNGPVRNTAAIQIDGFNFGPSANTEVKAPFLLKASTPKFIPQANFSRGHTVLLYTVPKPEDKPGCCTNCDLDVYVVVDGDTANPKKMTDDASGLNNRANADFFANDCHHSLWFEPTDNKTYQLDLYVVKRGDDFEPYYLADTLTLAPTTRPEVAVYTDLRELFKEFHEITPNSPSNDANGNCVRDYYEAVEAMYNYAARHDGVVHDVRQDAYSDDHDHYANIATRRKMGQEIDTNITANLQGFKLSLFDIAVIGDDAVVPYYRVQVPTGAFSETGYLRNNADANPTVLDTQSTADGANKGYLMSDLPYATYETDLPNHPTPNISIGRIFYDTPQKLIDAFTAYESPIDVRAARSRASAICLDNEWELNAAGTALVPHILWDDIFERAIRPVLQNRYGAGLQRTVPYTGPVAFQNGRAYLYRGAITPWNAVTSTRRAAQNTHIMLFYSHANQFVWTSEARRLLNGGSTDPRVQGSRDIDRRELANVGLRIAMSTGCHSGYNTAYRQNNVNHRLYRNNIVRAMLDEHVAYYAPTVYGYGNNTTTSHHDKLIREFLKGVFRRYYDTIGDAYYIALRKYTSMGGGWADLDKYAIYGMHLYGLPTQPLRQHATLAELRSASTSSSVRRPTAPTAVAAFSETIAVSNFAVAFDAEGRAVFDIPQQGGRTGEPFGPVLPAVVRTYALPSDTAGVTVTLVASQTHAYPGSIEMQTVEPINFTFGPVSGAFDQTGLYPTSVLTYRLISDVSGPLIEVTAIPLQYDLDARQVTLYDSITYRITYQAPATVTISNVQVNEGDPVAVGDAGAPISVTLDSTVGFTGTLVWSIEDGAGTLVANDVASLDVTTGTVALGWDVDATGWQPGPKHLWVAARDAQGNVVASGQATFQVTGTWLEADVAQPIYTETDTAAEIQARVRDQDGAGVSGQAGALSLWIDDADTAAAWQAGADGLYTATIALDGLAAGRHTFAAVLDTHSDSGGFIVDRSAPTSTLQAFSGVITSTWVSFDWRDDAANVSAITVEYQIDGGPWQVWQTVEPGFDFGPGDSLLFGPDTPVTVNLAQHTYCFRSQARDLAGHVEPQHIEPDTCSAPPCNSPKLVTVSGPPTTTISVAAAFTAAVTPLTATNVLPLAMPLTYTWQATELSSQTHVISEMIDSAVFTWNSTGGQWITVTVASPCGVEVQNTHSITVESGGYSIYLPLVMKNY